MTTYSKKKNGEKVLSKASPLLKVKEFACNDGSDKILISDSLITNLVKVYNAVPLFGYTPTSIIIESGYRTESYNKKVGGATGSRHTKGEAADVYMYYLKSGKKTKIPAKVLACAGQIADVMGIEVISDYNVHFDTRAAKWWSYKKGSSYISIGKTWLEYYKVTRPSIKAIKDVPIRKSYAKTSSRVTTLKKGNKKAVYGIKVKGAKNANIWYKADNGWTHKSGVV